MEEFATVWALYEKGCRRHERMALAANTEKAYRFYEGDQWRGIESDQSLPMYNFIAPTVRHKVESVALNQMRIYFSSTVESADKELLLRHLNQRAARWWEAHDMDTRCREVLYDSAVAGDGYLYIYDKAGHCQTVDNVNIFLGDETRRDIQSQPYLLIYERRSADELQRMARQNGADEEAVRRILPDNKGDEEDGKCGCVLYMHKSDKGLCFGRYTQFATVEPEKCIRSLHRYPVASLITAPIKGSARGHGEVLPLISNQIEINRNLARRIINAKLTAFSRLVYSADKIDDPEQLERVGSAIAVNDGGIASVNDAVGYVTPSPMSSDAKVICDEMIMMTRELAGAGTAVTGNLDPTQASGSAIIAVRDQAQILLGEQVAAFKKFVEDIARIWYELWICYHEGEEGLTAGQLTALHPSIRIDATSVTPFSKFAREECLEKLLAGGIITLAEYAEALDDDAGAPKAKLLTILKNRKAEQTCNL